MKTHKQLTEEADKALKDFETELKKVKEHVADLQQRWVRMLMLPILVIPFGIGYSLFKKHRAKKLLSSSPNTKNIVSQERNNSISWRTNLANELTAFALGKFTHWIMKRK